MVAFLLLVGCTVGNPKKQDGREEQTKYKGVSSAGIWISYSEVNSMLKSEIGILYMNDFNHDVIGKILRDNSLEFHHLIDCSAYVYIWKNHPLAKNKSITFEELADFPCLSFEQGEKGSFYFAEEILSTNEYPRTIKAADRSTMLNLMVGLNGYTLCSGIICEELNGSDFIAVPFENDDKNSSMRIGYITKNGIPLSEIGKIYINEMTKYLQPLI